MEMLPSSEPIISWKHTPYICSPAFSLTPATLGLLPLPPNKVVSLMLLSLRLYFSGKLEPFFKKMGFILSLCAATFRNLIPMYKPGAQAKTDHLHTLTSLPLA